MNTITIGRREELAPEVMTAMHEFRHEIFVRRLGWTLPSSDGFEQDVYDRSDTVYFVVRDSFDQINACARVLPTTQQYMLPELFPQLIGSNPVPADPAIWELSRFATDVRMTRDARMLALSAPTLNLLDSIKTFARSHGVERLLLVTSIAIERLMLRAGVGAHRLAKPALIDSTLCVALFIETRSSSRCASHAALH